MTLPGHAEQLPCAEKIFFNGVLFSKPPAWYVLGTTPSGARKTGSNSTVSLKKKIN